MLEDLDTPTTIDFSSQTKWEQYAESRDCRVEFMGDGVNHSYDAALNLVGTFYTMPDHIDHAANGCHTVMPKCREER
jgi:hypothetical protein